MNIQQCPQCGQESLATTGAFWSCSSCHIAITSQALSRDQHDSKLSPTFTTGIAASQLCVTA